MMVGKPDFAPVFGNLDFLDEFLSGLLPPNVSPHVPRVPLPEGEDEYTVSATSDFVFAETSAHDGEHVEDDLPASGQTTNGITGLLVPDNGKFSGVFVEGDEFAYARPGSDTSGGDTKGGGGGGKPPKDGGGTGGDGTADALLSSYTSGGNAKTSYNITINFDTGAWTVDLQQVFIDAAEYLSTIVLGDVSDERVPLYGRVDDLAIDASIIAIDGEGGTLGGAAVFASRVGSALPAASIMQFDVADIDQALAGGYLTHVVVHEMVHAMGFGAKWADMGLLETFTEDWDGVTQQVLRFTGGNATTEYNKLAVAENDPYSASGVLVEMDGGEGTEFVHWDDATFTDMLMTGFIDTSAPGAPTLSTMSIAALEDMGYDTIYEPSLDGLFA